MAAPVYLGGYLKVPMEGRKSEAFLQEAVRLLEKQTSAQELAKDLDLSACLVMVQHVFGRNFFYAHL